MKRKARTEEEFAITSLWTLSTGHMTQEDSTVLSQQEELVVYEYDEGFWVIVPDICDVGDDYWDRLRAYGVSGALCHIISVAIGKSVSIVRFDADGPTYDFLPLYNW